MTHGRRPRKPGPATPRWLRPRFDAERLTTIGIVHLSTLAEVASGTATAQTLWDMAEAVFTWHHVAERLGEGLPEMAPQLLLAAKVIERYGATGRIEFQGDEYAQAQTGVDVMDALAIRTDVATAQEAARWSDQYLARLVAEFRVEQRDVAHG